MTGAKRTSRPTSASSWVEGLNQEHDTHDVCSCDHRSSNNVSQKILPSVPHTSAILLNGHDSYAMIDSGAGPNLVQSEWLAIAFPDYRKYLQTKGAATTKFKLADGGKSASPEGTIQLSLQINGVTVGGTFWVLKQLTTNMIVGSKLLDELAVTINYSKRIITSEERPDIGQIHFDLKGVRKWRLDTSVTTRSAITLLPRTAQLVVGHIEFLEFCTLTVEDLVFGGVFPVDNMGDRGIEVKHTLNRVKLQFEGGDLMV